MPKLSVLIPVYNRRDMVLRAIDSACAQTLQDVEIIVCDNQSTDGTFDVVQERAKADARVRAFQNGSNLGPTRNWKRCLDEATGTYACLLFSDDWLEPEFGERMIARLEADPEIGFSFCSIATETTGELDGIGYGDRVIEMFTTSGKNSRETFIRDLTDWPDSQFVLRVPVSPGCALFRREELARWLVPDLPNSLGLDMSPHGAGVDVGIYLNALDDYQWYWFEEEKLVHFLAHSGSLTIGHPDIRRSYIVAIADAVLRNQAYRPHVRRYCSNAKKWLNRRGEPGDFEAIFAGRTSWLESIDPMFQVQRAIRAVKPKGKRKKG